MSDDNKVTDSEKEDKKNRTIAILWGSGAICSVAAISGVNFDGWLGVGIGMVIGWALYKFLK